MRENLIDTIATMESMQSLCFWHKLCCYPLSLWQWINVYRLFKLKHQLRMDDSLYQNYGWRIQGSTCVLLLVYLGTTKL